MNCKVGIIGFGSMGKMIFDKIVVSNIIPERNLFITNRTYDKIIQIENKYPNVNILRSNTDVVKDIDILFLCVKPLEIKAVLQEIVEYVSSAVHIVSLNGSVLFEQLEMICKNNKISKAIPSVTAEVNLSQTLVCHNRNVLDRDKVILEKLLSTFGTVIELPENEIGFGSELVSCMPGFIAAIFHEICINAKVHTRISDEAIIDMVKNTLYGTSKLILDNGLSFEEVIARVATKGGITEEGTKIIHEQFPRTVSDMFNKTILKRKITSENAIKQFNIYEDS